MNIKDFPHKVTSFTYNGFSGSTIPNIKTNYKAKFIKWTNDPGIGIFICSDGKERLIPTFAINNINILPKQVYINDKPDLFGTPCDYK